MRLDTPISDLDIPVMALRDAPTAFWSRPGIDERRPIALLRMQRQRPARPHGHDHTELVVIIDGGGEHVTDAGSWPVAAGDVFVIEPGYVHEYRRVRDLHLVNVLLFPLEHWFSAHDLAETPGWHALFTIEPRLREEHQFRSRLRLRADDLRRVGELLEDMERVQVAAAPGWIAGLVARFTLLIEALVQARGRGRSGQRRELLHLAEILAAIDADPGKPWSAAGLCRRAGCAPSTLQRWFNAAVGAPPHQWVLQRRLDHACRRLRDGSGSVTTIAHACGFHDANYFSRLFTTRLGESPSAYRRRHQR